MKEERCVRHAKAIVDKLLVKELIVLAPDEGARTRLEARLLRCVRNDVFFDGFAAERLLGVLVRCDAVEEVFADERAALRALRGLFDDRA